MKKHYFVHATFFLILSLFASCGWLGKLGKIAPVSLRYLDQQLISSDLIFQQTAVRGLSGIDYNPSLDQYYIISDDRSQNQPSRYYTAKITLDGFRIDSFWIERVDTLRNDAGEPFEFKATDPEAIRFDILSGFWVWSSEGERTRLPQRTSFIQPAIRVMNQRGMMLDSFRLPDRFRVNSIEKGARDNGTLEGMSFTPNFRQLWLCMEEPLYEDGPRIDTADNSSYVRIFGYDRFNGERIGEYAYQPEKVAQTPIPSSAYRINGVSEILFIDSTRFLVMERSFSEGRKGCTIRIFLADLKEATNISGMESLVSRRDFQPVNKRLLFNFDNLDRYIDNLEGMCFGPKLPNGNRSIIFVADDNFSATQESQIWLFELSE